MGAMRALFQLPSRPSHSAHCNQNLLTKRVSYVSENLRATKPAQPEAKPASNIGQQNSTGSGTQSFLSAVVEMDSIVANSWNPTKIMTNKKLVSHKTGLGQSLICFVVLISPPPQSIQPRTQYNRGMRQVSKAITRPSHSNKSISTELSLLQLVSALKMAEGWKGW